MFVEHYLQNTLLEVPKSTTEQNRPSPTSPQKYSLVEKKIKSSHQLINAKDRTRITNPVFFNHTIRQTLFPRFITITVVYLPPSPNLAMGNLLI